MMGSGSRGGCQGGGGGLEGRALGVGSRWWGQRVGIEVVEVQRW